MTAFPTTFSVSGMQPGEAPKVHITYQCDDINDAMRKVHEACAIHGSVSAHYDRETKVLTMELG